MTLFKICASTPIPPNVSTKYGTKTAPSLALSLCFAFLSFSPLVAPPNGRRPCVRIDEAVGCVTITSIN